MQSKYKPGGKLINSDTHVNIFQTSDELYKLSDEGSDTFNGKTEKSTTVGTWLDVDERLSVHDSEARKVLPLRQRRPGALTA
jgi:hypothetical protein